MTSFLTHAQQAELKSRVTRSLAPGKTGNHGGVSSALTAAESRTLEVVLDCMNDMHREGTL